MKYIVKVFRDNTWKVMHIGPTLERAKIMAHKSYITKDASSVRVIEVEEHIVYDYKFKK